PLGPGPGEASEKGNRFLFSCSFLELPGQRELPLVEGLKAVVGLPIAGETGKAVGQGGLNGVVQEILGEAGVEVGVVAPAVTGLADVFHVALDPGIAPELVLEPAVEGEVFPPGGEIVPE